MSTTYLIIGILGKIKLSGLFYWQVFYLANKKWSCFRYKLTKNSFAGFIQGNTLASVLDTLATVRDTEGAYFGGLPQDGECGYAFFSLPTDGLLLLGLSFKSFLCCKHRRSYSGWNRNFFPLSKKRIGGHKLEGDPTVLKLTNSFFRDGTIFATSFIK